MKKGRDEESPDRKEETYCNIVRLKRMSHCKVVGERESLGSKGFKIG